jgi:hypothetical protein
VVVADKEGLCLGPTLSSFCLLSPSDGGELGPGSASDQVASASKEGWRIEDKPAIVHVITSPGSVEAEALAGSDALPKAGCMIQVVERFAVVLVTSTWLEHSPVVWLEEPCAPVHKPSCCVRTEVLSDHRPGL